MALKRGPLTREEMMAVWAAAVDTSYREPLEQAGDGGGLEVYGQSAEQLARVSRAIETTSQACYILPHSGQTDDPASGETKATVTLTITRTKFVDKTLVLGAGAFFVEEETTDFGQNGPVAVRPGRVYVLTSDLVFPAGEMGPFSVEAEATLPGWGFNNPLPGTLKSPVQLGTGFSRPHATVIAAASTATVQTPARAIIRSLNEADTFIPDHVGQYVSFVEGANAGKVARILNFDAPPDPSIPVGSIVSIALDYTVDGTTFAGTFVIGELLTLPAGDGLLLGIHDNGGVRKLVYRLLAGSAANITDVITGVSSGATLTVRTRYDDGIYAAEAPSGSVGGAHWRVLDWAFDWGLIVTNELSPVGGKLGILDEIGRERDLGRAPGEVDDGYRVRVATLADVVSPNAIMRALSRSLGALHWCFREVGSASLRGSFYDGDLGPAGGFSNTDLTIADKDDAYDTDVALFTGLVGSGLTFDAGPVAAYDAGAFPGFYDGFGAFIGIPGGHEPVVLEDANNNVVMSGYFGRLDPAAVPNNVFVFVRKSGAPPSSLSGYHIRGLHTGALFFPASVVIPATVNERRFRRYFDYAEFRAFFLVGLPRLGFGDPGFAFDKGLHDAFDAAPFDAFYDGAPFGAADLYRRVYHAVDQARAGGVGFDFYIEDIGCP